MKPKRTKEQSMEVVKNYNTERILSSSFRPIVFNTKLASNPFLNNEQKYTYIIYKINDYNRRVNNNEVTDQYESMFYQRLHSIMQDLSNMEIKSDQLQRLQKIFQWVKEQEKLLEQRKDQGYVRYQVHKKDKKQVKVKQKSREKSEKSYKQSIPSRAIEKQLFPYRKNWRTLHSELEMPSKRLSEYKRKIINITPFVLDKEEKKAPKVLYPKVERQEEQKEEEEQIVQQNQIPVQIKEGEEQQETMEKEKSQQPQQNEQVDLGFGQQPEQAEEEEPKEDEETKDKLAPKRKNYTIEFQDRKVKQYSAAYLFFKGEDIERERRIQQLYTKRQNQVLKKQKEDISLINVTSARGQYKSKIEKELQKKLQNINLKAKYSIAHENNPEEEKLPIEQQIKYGLRSAEQIKKEKTSEVYLDEFSLPKIAPQTTEKKQAKRRLKSLKGKFGKMLNLAEYEERQAGKSLCQYNPRKRELSAVFKQKNQQTEVLEQINEVNRLKEYLSFNKGGINMRSLSMGLISPVSEEGKVEQFPGRQLPSNPFFVEVKKKKKKGK